MNCDELVERTTDYLEGALESGDRTRLAGHLSQCPGCKAHFGEVQVTLGLLSGLPAEQISDELEANLLTMYRNWTESVRS